MLTGVLLVIGVGFLVANLRLLVDYVQFMRRRRGALLVWRGPRQKNEMVGLVLGLVLGVLVIVKFWTGQQTFSETMMLVYFGFILLVAYDKPLLATRILPGLSLGMLLGSLVIVTAWVLIWIYVRWANGHYDTTVKSLREKR